MSLRCRPVACPRAAGSAGSAVEFLPPFVVALPLLPFVIAVRQVLPWQPSTIDLQVYVYAVKDMLAGKDIFATTTPFWNLYFIYPPIAAVLDGAAGLRPVRVLAAGLDRRPGLGPAVGAEALRRSPRLEARADRCRGGAGGRADPHHPRLRPGQHHADGPGGRRPAAATSPGRAAPDPPGLADRTGRGDQADPGAVRRLRVPDRQAAGSRCTGRDQLRRLHRHRRDLPVLRDGRVLGGLSGGNTRTASPLYAGNQSLLGVFFRLRRLVRGPPR